MQGNTEIFVGGLACGVAESKSCLDEMRRKSALQGMATLEQMFVAVGKGRLTILLWRLRTPKHMSSFFNVARGEEERLMW